jgi:hypothetical protein
MHPYTYVCIPPCAHMHCANSLRSTAAATTAHIFHDNSWDAYARLCLGFGVAIMIMTSSCPTLSFNTHPNPTQPIQRGRGSAHTLGCVCMDSPDVFCQEELFPEADSKSASQLFAHMRTRTCPCVHTLQAGHSLVCLAQLINVNSHVFKTR